MSAVNEAPAGAATAGQPAAAAAKKGPAANLATVGFLPIRLSDPDPAALGNPRSFGQSYLLFLPQQNRSRFRNLNFPAN
jgi:hypothetical protein